MPVHHRTVSALALAGLFAVGCTPGVSSPGEDDDADEPEDRPAATVTIPPVRLTPFCRAMNDLADRLANDPPDDPEAAIVEVYEDIQDEVPAEIRADFDVVLAELRGEPVPTTAAPEVTTTLPVGPDGDELPDEGYDPEETPALRLNAYVAFECQDIVNNPGPPATQPLGEVETTEP